MTRRGYGQYCGIARGLELVGERWALLVLRDLCVGPRRYGDLRRALPRIPTNILAERLRELEAAGVIQRRMLEEPAGVVVYELTAYGAELEEVVLALGRWGARALGEPRPEDVVTVESLVMALRAAFSPAHAADVRASWEVRMGPVVLHAIVDGGQVSVAEGPLPSADLVLECEPALHALLSGALSPEEALRDGTVRLTGRRALLDRFVEVFRI